MDKETLARMLTVTLDIGTGLLEAGAEVHRVEDTMNRLAAAYGVVKSDVFVITTGMHATWRLTDGTTLTETRRVHDKGTDLTLLEQYNDLSRRICRDLPDPETAMTLVRRVQESEAPRLHKYRMIYPLFSMGAAASFAIFFGGDLLDGLASGIGGLGVYLMGNLLRRHFDSGLVQTLLNSFLTACFCILMCHFGLGHNVDKVMIGTVMLLVPGVSCTTALRDMMAGDTISGLLRLCNAMLTAGALVCGYVLAMELLGGAL